MINRLAKKLLIMIVTVSVIFTMIPLSGAESFADDGLNLVLVSDSANLMEGKPVNVKASGDPEYEKEAWVGLYLKGEVPGAVNSLREYYVGDFEGRQVDITGGEVEKGRPDSIKPGEYTIYLFKGRGYAVEKSIDITIKEDPDRAPTDASDEFTLTLADSSKTEYKLGEPVTIKATGSSEGAWVGLYKENDTPGPVPSTRWYYIEPYFNGINVNIVSASNDVNPNGAIKEGSYKILLFGDEKYDNIVAELHFTIEGIVDFDPDSFSIETDKTEYTYKEDIKVKATGTGVGESAWVGLYPAGTTEYSDAYLYRYPVSDADGYWTVIQDKTKGKATGDYVGNGSYKAVIFAYEGYDYPVKSAEFSVTRELTFQKLLRDPGCTTLGLEYVTYEDDTSEYREIPDLGGHIWGTPQKIEGKGLHTFVCERDPEHRKTKACTPADSRKTITAASLTEEGISETVCEVCGGTLTEAIPRLAEKPVLAKSKLVYSGKTQKPALKAIIDANGNVIDSSMYTVTYPKASKKAGKYSVTVRFKDRYTGTYKLTYRIVPKKVTLKKLAKKSKSFTVKWGKAKAQTTGYQIAYSTNSKFKSAKYKRVSGIKKTSTTIKGLKGNKTYYVKVRAYKKVSGKRYYSAWSNVKTVKTGK